MARFFYIYVLNKRMMEKLIVKNFGPIKEAEIDLTKYVVFIGDTSTGKSVLAKLISIFRDSFYILSLKRDLSSIDFRKELKRYNIDFDTKNSVIYYCDGDQILLELKKNEIVLFDKEINEAYYKELKSNDNLLFGNSSFLNFSDIDKEEIIGLAINNFIKKNTSTYIPAERILFSLIGNSLSGLWANNVALPECYKDFAGKYEVSRREADISKFPIFEMDYNFNKGVDKIILNGIEILLSEASSGIQSLIPLLLVIDYEINNSNSGYLKSLIIEEPELNLFPKRQKMLIDYIIHKLNKKASLIITTHSPYILSSLDTLMLAKNTFNEHPDLKEEINSIVSEDKWIDYNDISVYEVRNDGKVYSIKNEEFKSIDVNAIDSVSDIISEEFDKLTELRYAH
jgi:predicted ATPase